MYRRGPNGRAEVRLSGPVIGVSSDLLHCGLLRFCSRARNCCLGLNLPHRVVWQVTPVLTNRANDVAPPWFLLWIIAGCMGRAKPPILSHAKISCGAAPAVSSDDLSRDVYSVFGLPIDVLDMPEVLRRIDAAATSRIPFFVSTPNLHFLVQSRGDLEFQESLLDSDLCPPDGMPIVWIARLIGAPVKQRVSGSDIFDALKTQTRAGRPLRVFLFGGEKGVAEAAAKALNIAPAGLSCVGTLNPGFGTVEDMSRADVLAQVNACDADFLVASLGAKKGQLWLHRNHKRLITPVRAHLGAVLNFAAGTVKRAPSWIQACSLEWLWRIKEEPHLWRRYAGDGSVLLLFIFARVIPLAIVNWFQRLKSSHNPKELAISIKQHHNCTTISFSGDANRRSIGKAIACFQETLTKGTTAVLVDLAGARAIDARFLGLLLMLRKCLNEQSVNLAFVGISPATRRLFRLNQVDFLFDSAVEKSLPNGPELGAR
jgi:N-acetylglucosaminyldiphosphoundecaprenol N-acetyl-beta-D-mannosaminyltransferase